MEATSNFDVPPNDVGKTPIAGFNPHLSKAISVILPVKLGGHETGPAKGS